jgi:hypothetical protein
MHLIKMPCILFKTGVIIRWSECSNHPKVHRHFIEAQYKTVQNPKGTINPLVYFGDFGLDLWSSSDTF